jgi:hypothetical protein
MYTGGRTPNAFNNNPVDALGGIRIYPARWWGIGAAYRRHMNQQDAGHFNQANFNTAVANLSGVFVPGRGIVIVPGTTFPATNGGAPIGYHFSDDPNGFIFQFWVGHRNPRLAPVAPVTYAPVGSVTSSMASITLPCPPGFSSDSCTASASRSVELIASYTDQDNDTLLYTWSVSGGTLSGEGKTVQWDLSAQQPGTYTATVSVNDGNGHIVPGSATVTIAACDCHPPCPTVSVSCPADVELGAPITFNASVGGDANVTYNWTISAGTISSGQGTSSITVDSNGLGGQTVTATLELGGLDPSCSRTASCSTLVKGALPQARKFDEYGNIKFNDEKARLDNYAIQLQNEPGSQGYIIAYGACEGEAQARADRAKDYLVNTRGIDGGRLVTIDGGCAPELKVELWIVPTGAAAPTANNPNAVSPCPACKKAAAPRRRRGRRDDE